MCVCMYCMALYLQTPLVRYLKRFQLLASDKVINMFPSSIYLENYVALRVAVRKYVFKLKKILHACVYLKGGFIHFEV